MSTKILSCDCEHAYQDELYGRGKRVHNLLGGSDRTSPLWRCTVCQKKRQA